MRFERRRTAYFVDKLNFFQKISLQIKNLMLL